MGWENNVRRVVPYVPGEQPKKADVIKLNTNENPYPPSLEAEKAAASMSTDELRLYPDPSAESLVRAIAGCYGLKENEVFVGVGSDDVLAMCFMTFFNSGKPIVFPDITYSFYDVWADLLRIPYKTPPLTEDFRINPADYRGENGGIVFPNPNAPTGSFLPMESVEEIVAANRESVVIVDEAYVDFGAESALPLIRKYDNLIVVQTFSKSRSMAGLRIGYAMADEKLIRYLNDVKYSFNSYTLNRPSILIGTAEMNSREHFKECCARIAKTREASAARFRGLGFSLTDSCANFLFVTHPDKTAKEIFDYLKENRIYVRWFDKPRIRNYLRVTIGTDQEMDRLFACLSELF
ncbi:MAG TPA: histidinol-phosphate transaminase [Lachnospiraceae bacterium]|nr:histidinol-phosphate transaminase [Lachnospiraceae bacterium]